MKIKNIHDIHTAMNYHGETLFIGTDERGKEFEIVFDTYEILQWFNVENAKETLIKKIEAIGKND